ncbi:MAG TPA: sensor histidine kinase [Gammaproteobacteria bacterium]|nr:sensor histidine kinase [Gammaproteobacteria bacterium]
MKLLSDIFQSLYARLALALSIVLIGVGLLYTLFSLVMIDRLDQRAQQQLNRNLAAGLVQDQRIVHDGGIDHEAMKHTFMQYMVINPAIEIYYLDLQGKILSYSADPGVVKRNSVSLDPIHAFLDGKPMFPLLGDDPRSHERQKPFSVTPIPDADHARGYLYVVLQGEEYAAAYQLQSQRYLIVLGGAALAGSLLLGLLTGLFIFSRLTRRLNLLQRRVTTFAESDFHTVDLFQENPSMRGDEINRLEGQIAQMSRHIARQWSKLKHNDQARRQMFASISHDLRTPLASIQGYLETVMLKQQQLSGQQLDHYLGIALKQTHRLQKQIDQLFEYARLEANERQLHVENFSMLELVYDVVNKFSIKAAQQGIQLSVEESAENLQVNADIGLVESLLDNLIDNALQHTPSDGEVKVNVSRSGAQVLISVTDSGPGIPESQQTRIFDHFYRAGNVSRSDDHAGLGLAIVKKIIEMHRQQIQVETPAGGGAVFAFTLQPAEVKP